MDLSTYLSGATRRYVDNTIEWATGRGPELPSARLDGSIGTRSYIARISTYKAEGGVINHAKSVWLAALIPFTALGDCVRSGTMALVGIPASIIRLGLTSLDCELIPQRYQLNLQAWHVMRCLAYLGQCVLSTMSLPFITFDPGLVVRANEALKLDRNWDPDNRVENVFVRTWRGANHCYHTLRQNDWNVLATEFEKPARRTLTAGAITLTGGMLVYWFSGSAKATLAAGALSLASFQAGQAEG